MNVGGGKFSRRWNDPTEGFTLIAFGHQRDLIVKASEKIERIGRDVTGQNVARDDAYVLAVARHLFADQVLDRGADMRSYQPGFPGGRTADGDDPFGGQAAGAKKTTDRDHVLIADRPDGLLRMDGLEKMDMGAYETRRMRPVKGGKSDARPLRSPVDWRRPGDRYRSDLR